jgi:hypothetical protein
LASGNALTPTTSSLFSHGYVYFRVHARLLGRRPTAHLTLPCYSPPDTPPIVALHRRLATLASCCAFHDPSRALYFGSPTAYQPLPCVAQDAVLFRALTHAQLFTVALCISIIFGATVGVGKPDDCESPSLLAKVAWGPGTAGMSASRAYQPPLYPLIATARTRLSLCLCSMPSAYSRALARRKLP